MHENSFCLNCGQPAVGKFCSNCGQKTDTHRITFKHLIFHDIIHGVWHIEKGIIFTLKQALIRPGRAAIEYISATVFLGIMLVFIASLLLMFCNYVENFEWIAICSDYSILYLLLFFIIASYYQAVGKMYSKLGFLWRILTLVASIVVVLIFAIYQIE